MLAKKKKIGNDIAIFHFLLFCSFSKSVIRYSSHGKTVEMFSSIHFTFISVGCLCAACVRCRTSTRGATKWPREMCLVERDSDDDDDHVCHYL